MIVVPVRETTILVVAGRELEVRSLTPPRLLLPLPETHPRYDVDVDVDDDDKDDCCSSSSSSYASYEEEEEEEEEEELLVLVLVLVVLVLILVLLLVVKYRIKSWSRGTRRVRGRLRDVRRGRGSRAWGGRAGRGIRIDLNAPWCRDARHGPQEPRATSDPGSPGSGPTCAPEGRGKRGKGGWGGRGMGG